MTCRQSNIQGRNFALNPKEGLKISAFKNAHTQAAMADRELAKLARYLLHIANTHEDFRDAKHAVSDFVRSSVGYRVESVPVVERRRKGIATIVA